MVRWQSGRRSENVEDRRRMSPAAAAGGGISIVMLLIVFVLTGGDLGKVMQFAQQQQQQQQQPGDAGAEVDRPLTPEEEEMGEFVSVILADTEDVWTDLFAREGKRYQPTTLVLFSGKTNSRCGFASAAIGPFYCPGDEKVYIDLAFYDDLKRKFRAPGDFAQAYVVAHEVGHHVQNLYGLSDQVHRKQQQVSEEEGNRLSVRLELQADYLAGVWAHHADKQRGILERGDIDEGIRAAIAIGDDTLQKQAQGYVVPENFTHGSSEQRVRWFRKGLQSGDMDGMMQTFELRYEDL